MFMLSWSIGISSNYSDDQPYSWTFPPFHPKSEIYKDSKVCITKDNPFPQSNLVCPVETKLQPDGTLPDIESTYEAIQFLQRTRLSGIPFFLAVGFHKPHIPLKYPKHFKKFHPLDKVLLPNQRRKPPGLPIVAWNPWTDLREREDVKELNISFPFGVIKDKQARLIIQSYYAAVSYVDDLIGLILKEIIHLQLDKTTVIGLIGDHGWSLGEHGEWSKYSNFDIATRVPLILKIPGLSDRNLKINDYNTVDVPVELVDLFPTLVDATGLQSIRQCGSKSKTTKLCTEGKSLLPLIMNALNNGTKKEERYFALSQYPRPGEYPTLKPNSDKPKLKEIKIMGCSIRTERFRYTEWCGFQNFSINWRDTKACELYDHYLDPMENLNLSEDKIYFEIRKELSNMLRLQWNTY
ncbi:unnamed protein product [Nezara viridula]|uniref:Sulfatase N-terminal domain-containing protein n=1 Tax=Nezara viridula TaxID=85310 RepID=A0A9P0HCY1_NEZVI|nr:unnamed protein product [Nezara viridula]